ncbi:SAM-dependent methyltransferase [Cysteiniphilum marinum]|uniref:SAM-dependent methyltransferase n=1 Tax=Cysteiniphilum marinum TaxID=2774191 RepID=UPI00193962F6|nr:SAM-dependent methyltransferase [Cysteiniphilum marinum]
MKNLCVLGAGIKSIAHLTIESVEFLKNADVVLGLLNEPIAKDFIKSKAKKFIDLENIYYSDEVRYKAYANIAEYIVEQTEYYDNVCVIFYGHPMYCVTPSIEAINQAMKKNINIISCPAVSSLDCLLSDLYIDPLENGMQIYTADDLISNKITIDNNIDQVIMQIGFINHEKHVHLSKNENLDNLKSKLLDFYHGETVCFIYEASLYSNCLPIINKQTIASIEKNSVSTLSTLFIPKSTSKCFEWL